MLYLANLINNMKYYDNSCESAKTKTKNRGMSPFFIKSGKDAQVPSYDSLLALGAASSRHEREIGVTLAAAGQATGQAAGQTEGQAEGPRQRTQRGGCGGRLSGKASSSPSVFFIFFCAPMSRDTTSCHRHRRLHSGRCWVPTRLWREMRPLKSKARVHALRPARARREAVRDATLSSAFAFFLLVRSHNRRQAAGAPRTAASPPSKRRRQNSATTSAAAIAGANLGRKKC